MAPDGDDGRQILASLTTNPAGTLGYGNRSRRVEKGIDADLIILRADPTYDVRAFSKIRHTIHHGRVIETIAGVLH